MPPARLACSASSALSALGATPPHPLANTNESTNAARVTPKSDMTEIAAQHDSTVPRRYCQNHPKSSFLSAFLRLRNNISNPIETARERKEGLEVWCWSRKTMPVVHASRAFALRLFEEAKMSPSARSARASMSHLRHSGLSLLNDMSSRNARLARARQRGKLAGSRLFRPAAAA